MLGALGVLGMLRGRGMDPGVAALAADRDEAEPDAAEPRDVRRA